MPGEREGQGTPKEEMRSLLPNAFRYFEEIEEAATRVGSHLENLMRTHGLTAEETEALKAAAEQNELGEEMLEALEDGNLSYVIAHLEGVVRDLLGQKEATREGLLAAQKAGQALQELRAAQEKMLH